LGAEFLRGLSTVGFGDIIPTTAAGRWVTVIAVLVGFVLIPWQATRLREASTAPEVACPWCGASVSADDQYCRQCGETLVDEQFD